MKALFKTLEWLRIYLQITENVLLLGVANEFKSSVTSVSSIYFRRSEIWKMKFSVPKFYLSVSHAAQNR